MSYAAAIDQLNAMVPELYTSSGQARRKFSLDEIRVLLDALGNPHRRFPSVLIAGTNGKGSTAATLASILTASGMRTGLYTSPHLSAPTSASDLIASKSTTTPSPPSSFVSTTQPTSSSSTAGCRNCPVISRF